jgi:hypothetical protein
VYDLLATENVPFTVALGLLVLLAIIQLVGLGDFGADADLDSDFDADGAHLGMGDALASLIGLGRLPLMAWLSLLLAAFGLIGLSGQHLFAGLIGHALPPLPASGLALLAALPVTGLVARPLARIWPQDETTAIDVEMLLARRGHIVIGTASRGNPARASVRDQHGQTHNVMVEPHEDGTRFAQGEEVLLVRREGDLFYAVPCDPPFLTAGI